MIIINITIIMIVSMIMMIIITASVSPEGCGARGLDHLPRLVPLQQREPDLSSY